MPPDPIADAANTVLAPLARSLADKAADKLGVTDPAVRSEIEQCVSHGLNALLGSIAPLAEKLAVKLLGGLGPAATTAAPVPAVVPVT